MLDLNKPVQTRDGRAVRIIATNVIDDIPGVDAVRNPGQTILAEVTDEDGSLSLESYDPRGQFDVGQGDTNWDLVNVPEKPKLVERFFAAYFNSKPTLNVIGGGGPAIVEVTAGDYRATRADKHSFGIKVTFENGVPVSVSLA